MTEEEIVQGKCKLIASQYVENLILRGKVAGGQKLDSEEYPEFLNQFISIMDCNGEKISDLSYIQKVSVINEWKESEIERLTKHFEEYPELAMMTAAENEIEGNTLIELPENYNISDYIELRKKNVNEYLKKNSKTVLKLDGFDESMKYVVEKNNTDLLNIYKSNYRKGRILVRINNSSSSLGGVGLGHAALMTENYWNPNWNNDVYAHTSISAWTANNYACWTGMKDGVQYEPLGYWTGSHDSTPEYTFIFDVYGADENKYDSAAELARSYLNRGYSIAYVRNNDAKFYCSKLVWYCWNQAWPNIDLDANGGLL